MSAHTEQEVINGCRNRERYFQEYLYRQYYSLFLKICSRYARDMQDAEQLLNDGMLRIFEHVGDFEGKGNFEGWMKRIMVNTCLDYLRSRYLKTSMQMNFNTTMVNEMVISISNDAVSKIQFSALLAMVQGLSPMTRTVFNLFVFEGYSHKEIAKLLDISEGTSCWHVNNARNQLQEKIRKQNAEKKTYETKRI